MKNIIVRTTLTFISFSTLLATLSVTSATEPERQKGISMHMLPKQVADLDGKRWGFTVSYAEYLEPDRSQPVLQSPTDFLTFVRKHNKSVQENGVWIVTTHPDAYSEAEKLLLKDIKALCHRENIPLFITRGSRLPDGWERYDIVP